MEDTASPTILVVDDSPLNVEFMRKHLGSMGYQVVVSYRGVDAIKQAQEAPPDLVLLDVVMPDLTGFEVCRLLKNPPGDRGRPGHLRHRQGPGVRPHRRAGTRRARLHLQAVPSSRS